MTSNTSAGPLLVDNAKMELIFADNGPSSFIGKANLSGNTTYYKTWLYLSHSVRGMTFDSHFSTRKVGLVFNYLLWLSIQFIIYFM